ncbi:hypothetical protein ABIA70_002385 [Arthrobacter sp. 754]
MGHLLLYSAVYAAWARRAGSGVPSRQLPPPGHTVIFLLTAALILVTWVVRWWFPVDDWVPLFFVLPAEPANLAQYLSMFVLGIMAYSNDWFRRIPRRAGLVWLVLGTSAAAAAYWLQASNLWVVSVGLVVAFREVFHTPTPFLAPMATASYAAYIPHVFVVVGLQVALLQTAWPPGAKFVVVSVPGLFCSFGIGHVSRFVPGLRVLLGTTPLRAELARGPGDGRGMSR